MELAVYNVQNLRLIATVVISTLRSNGEFRLFPKSSTYSVEYETTRGCQHIRDYTTSGNSR